jgi:hypothetical protein
MTPVGLGEDALDASSLIDQNSKRKDHVCSTSIPHITTIPWVGAVRDRAQLGSRGRVPGVIDDKSYIFNMC